MLNFLPINKLNMSIDMHNKLLIYWVYLKMIN